MITKQLELQILRNRLWWLVTLEYHFGAAQVREQIEELEREIGS